MSSVQLFQLTYVKSEILAPGVNVFHFDSLNINLAYKPGQYIRMTLSIESPDERGASRFFSIASSPTNTSTIKIVTKIGPSTFKQKLFNLKGGEKVSFRGPFGSFILEEESLLPQIMLTGGIGITPFISMVSYAVEKKLSIPITLFASFSTPQEIIMKTQFEEYEKINSNFKYIPTVTHPEKTQVPWMGNVGRIDKQLLEKRIPNVKDCIYYIVGPEGMNRALRLLLSDLEVPEENIRLEDFTGY